MHQFFFSKLHIFYLMKKQILFGLLASFIVVSGVLFFRSDAHISLGKETKQSSIRTSHPYEDYFLARQFPDGDAGIKAYDDALQSVKRMAESLDGRSSGSWIVQGPGNIGARINTLAVNPVNPLIIFAGFSEGGLFRTTNGGQTWKPVFDGQSRLSIGAVVIDPTNPNTIYVGTGDPNVSGYPFIGEGLFKSVDGGDTWQYLGLRDTRIISRIRISSTNPNVIYAATMGLPFVKDSNRGLYKTTDGGVTWKKILYVSDSTGITDLVIHPQDHNIIYAAGWNRIRNNKRSLVSGPDAKIYKSTDGGDTWRILTGGLPQDKSSRVGIDICISDPRVLYACYADGNNFNLKAVYRSTDSGETWISLPLGPESGLDEDAYAGFGWYFGQVRVNPADPDDVFILAVDLYRSRDGGYKWEEAAPPWWSYDVHADKHDLIFSAGKIYLGTDGGAYSAGVDDDNWRDIENIPTTQFYRVAYNPNYPDLYYGGAQDNGTTGGNAASINDWQRIYGGDGFQCLFHPTDEAVFYTETQNGGLAVTQDGGLSFNDANAGITPNDSRNWDMPIIMSTHNPDVLYTGTNKIYKNSSGPQVMWQAISPNLTDPESNWYRHNITSVHESPVKPGYLAAGTSDARVWVSPDDGTTWKEVTPGLPNRYVSSVRFSKYDKNTIYVAFTGYKDNDDSPYIYRSEDLGDTWQPIQGNLPRVAINGILVLPPSSEGTDSYICVATDGGVFYTANAGQQWQRLGDNMPYVAVYDLTYNEANNQLVAGTFGRSIQSFDLEQIGYVAEPTGITSLALCKTRLAGNVLSECSQLTLLNECDHGAAATAEYYVSDMSGRIRRKGMISGIRTDIETSHLEKGVYFLVLKPGTRDRETHRFVRI